MGLTFDYTPRLGPQGVEYDPLVDAVFTNPKNSKRVEIRSLIDSGAASIMLNGQFAKALGIDLTRGDAVAFQGIAHEPVVAYMHLVLIRLTNDSHEYLVPCFFLPELKMPALLGQRGFFEHYKVVFERHKKRFQLTPLPQD